MRRILGYAASTMLFTVSALAASEAELMRLADRVIALSGSIAEWRKVCHVRDDRAACHEALDEIEELDRDNEEMLETGTLSNMKLNRMEWNLEVLENKLLEVQKKYEKK